MAAINGFWQIAQILTLEGLSAIIKRNRLYSEIFKSKNGNCQYSKLLSGKNLILCVQLWPSQIALYCFLSFSRKQQVFNFDDVFFSLPLYSPHYPIPCQSLRYFSCLSVNRYEVQCLQFLKAFSICQADLHISLKNERSIIIYMSYFTWLDKVPNSRSAVQKIIIIKKLPPLKLSSLLF